MEIKVFIPSALKIYNLGLSAWMDLSWTENYLRHTIESHVQRRQEPKNMFLKALPNGFLYFMGCEFFDRMFNVQENALADEIETILDELSQLIIMLNMSGLPLVESTPPYRESLFNLYMTYDEIDGIYYNDDIPRNRVKSVFRRKHLQFEVYDQIENILDQYSKELRVMKHLYAVNYAERVFHDREMCQYISYALVSIFNKKGFPRLNSDGLINIEQVTRKKWPSWVSNTLKARERSRCANCQNSISELDCEFHIDHIVPLSLGGCNDIVNLQLLCSKCNLTKAANLSEVSSSIPDYFKLRRSMKQERRDITQKD